MSSVWKIGTTGQAYVDAATFAATGLNNLRRTCIANGMGNASFDAPSAAALTDDLAFSYGSTYIIWKDGVRWFYGRMVSLPRQGDPENETRNVVLADPFWYFQNTTYMQSWRVYDINGAVLANVNKCRVVLFQDSTGARAATGAQVADMVDWLISRGAPIAKGTIDAGITLPFDERTNLSCADVLDTVLRWTPDCIGWFDFTTAPHPTFHFRAKANLAAASLALTGQGLSTISITPRYDLQKPGVYITYEKTHSVDNVTYNTVSTDIAGNQAAIDCVYGVFDLQGTSRTYVKQKIVTENYPTANSKSWWKSRVMMLAGMHDDNIVIHDHAVDAAISEYSRILLEGMVQDWMLLDAVQGCIRAQADLTIRKNPANTTSEVIEVRKNVSIVAQVTATEAATHTYQRLTSFDSGEETPIGVAAALYNAWSILHFEGQIQLTEDECLGTYLPGKCLNLTGGRTEWTAMAALIQQTTEDVDSGVTSVQFGPSDRIEADSLVALFRAFRSRRFSWQASSRSTGSAVGSGEVELSGKVSDSGQSSGGGETQRLVISDSNDEGAHSMQLDPTVVTHAAVADEANRVIAPREVWVPQLNGATVNQLVYKLRQVLCSEAYHADQIVGALIRLKELLDLNINTETLVTGHGIKWDAATGKWVNGVVAGGAADNPSTEIDTLGAGEEGSETAATDTWTAGNANDHGLALWQVCRTVYNHAGDKKIYSFLRKLTFDKYGKLYSVSAETRVEVDATVAES